MKRKIVAIECNLYLTDSDSHTFQKVEKLVTYDLQMRQRA